MLHPNKTKIQLEFTEQIKTYSWNPNMFASLVVSEIFKHFLEENQSVNAHLACYIVCMYVCMFNNNKGLKKSNTVTQKFVIFSMDFSHRWLRISETTDHTKILEPQDYVFKVFVILIFYGQKH